MAALEIVRYHPSLQEEWDAFVDKSNNGTLFHKRAFLNYHPPNRFVDDSLLFYRKGRLFAVFPAARRHGDAGKLLISHPGASFGGFVVGFDLSLRSATELAQHIIHYARTQRYGGIDITLPPVIYLKRPSNYLDFALYTKGFRYRKREVSSVIPLDVREEDVLQLFKPEARTAVRKAQKSGIRVEMSGDIPTFYAILERNLKLRHNVMPTHTLAELQDLVRRFPEEIRLFAAYLEQTMVAGIVLFRTNAATLLAFYVSHDEAYQRYRAVNLLFYEVFRWCIRQQFKFLDFGIFTVNMEPNWGLARFKESFGAQGIFRDSMQLIWL